MTQVPRSSQARGTIFLSLHAPRDLDARQSHSSLSPPFPSKKHNGGPQAPQPRGLRSLCSEQHHAEAPVPGAQGFPGAAGRRAISLSAARRRDCGDACIDLCPGCLPQEQRPPALEAGRRCVLTSTKTERRKRKRTSARALYTAREEQKKEWHSRAPGAPSCELSGAARSFFSPPVPSLFPSSSSTLYALALPSTTHTKPCSRMIRICLKIVRIRITSTN